MLISKLAEKTELHPETIRRLEKKGIITAKRDLNGWRHFSPEAVTKLRELYAKPDEAVQNETLTERRGRSA
jgi:DNA-binding transcriptional MerR regulator